MLVRLFKLVQVSEQEAQIILNLGERVLMSSLLKFHTRGRVLHQ